MKYAVGGAILVVAGLCAAWWLEDPFVTRDRTLTKLLDKAGCSK